MKKTHAVESPATSLGVDVPELRQARALWQIGRLDDSLNLFAAAVRKYPQNLLALVDASRAFGARFELTKAEELLDRLVRYAKHNPELTHWVAQTYRMIFRPEKAMKCFEGLLRRTARNPDTCLELAVLYERLHRLHEALELVEEALKLAPDYAAAELFKGRLLRRVKDMPAGEQIFNRLAQDESAHPLVRAQAWAELAQKRDGEGDYAGAMEAMLRCKDLVRAEEGSLPGESEALQRHLSNLAGELSADHFRRWAGAVAGAPPRKQSVLTSFPRSGTTLIEQVLDTHPGLVSSDEREAFGRDIFPAMWRSEQTPLPTAAALDAVPPQRLAALRERYFDYLSAALNESIEDRMHLDKNPTMTLLIPAMVRLFPETRLLIALRDPRDVVVSCFMQYLPLNQNSVSFLTLERAAARYAHDMGVWLKLKPLLATPWLEVRYEDCVTGLENQARRSLEFLGLPWDNQVLAYRERLKEKPVNSPTYEAVSKPLYTSSIGRWQHYRTYLEPHLPILEGCVRALGYDL